MCNKAINCYLLTSLLQLLTNKLLILLIKIMNHWPLLKEKNTSKKSCYFCGGFLHANRATYRARDAICHNCSKRGHFSKVCQSAATTVSAIYKPSLCTITAACPLGLRHASVPALINGKVSLTALIDSCSSDNFISENAFKRLQIPASPSSKKVTMASTSMETPISGQCNVAIEVNGRKYQVRLDILQIFPVMSF